MEVVDSAKNIPTKGSVCTFRGDPGRVCWAEVGNIQQAGAGSTRKDGPSCRPPRWRDKEGSAFPLRPSVGQNGQAGGKIGVVSLFLRDSGGSGFQSGWAWFKNVPFFVPFAVDKRMQSV